MALAGALLFLGAGTLGWSWGRLYFGLLLAVTVAHGGALLLLDPALLAERSRGTAEPRAPLWDRLLVTVGVGMLPHHT